MDFISEEFRKKIQTLAGIMLEVVTMADKEVMYKDSPQRIPFDRALMRQAIERGQEVGLSFQSNNEKYKMPVTKFRIIQPVAMGMSKKGELVIRALHVLGQSEREAMETGQRSAEVENEWRLFKAKNIKGMWLTGRYFAGPMPGYNPNDKGMTSVEVAIDFAKAREYQNNLSKEQAFKDRAAQQQTQNKNIKPLFKKDIPGPNRPLPKIKDIPSVNKNPSQEPGQDNSVS